MTTVGPSGGTPLGGGAGAASLEQDLQRAELAKLLLEQEDLRARIASHETPRQRWSRLAVAVAVPILTAGLALFAAWMELRRVEGEREELRRERLAFQAQQDRDFIDHRRAQLVARLAEPSGRLAMGATLASLSTLLPIASDDAERVAQAVLPLLRHGDPAVRDAAAGLLSTLETDLLGRFVAAELQGVGGADRATLLALASGLSAEQGAGHLQSLLLHQDAVTAGVALQTLASHQGTVRWALDRFDEVRDENLQEALLTIVLLGQDHLGGRDELAPLLEPLASAEAAGVRSVEARAACYILGTGPALAPAPPGSRLADHAGYPLGNRLLLAEAFGDDRLYREVMADPARSATLGPGLMGFLLGRHGDEAPAAGSDDPALADNPTSSPGEELSALAGSEDVADRAEARGRLAEMLAANARGFWQDDFMAGVVALSHAEDVSDLLAEFARVSPVSFYFALDQVAEVDRDLAVTVLRDHVARDLLDVAPASVLAIDAGLGPLVQDLVVSAVPLALQAWAAIDGDELLTDPRHHHEAFYAAYLLLGGIEDEAAYAAAKAEIARAVAASPLVPREGVLRFSLNVGNGSMSVSDESALVALAEDQPTLHARLLRANCLEPFPPSLGESHPSINLLAASLHDQGEAAPP